ncbi:uncharacterized protein LOC120358683 [Solenopsis invicta]|uniref:uncharacterized protein LOC120358683 n=1 Tax=Solenopsis invicta TaxID=13686 RepID=UPI00193E77A3|nr:uncharacterized protein LOC120358683 [Solenopsis invicta]
MATRVKILEQKRRTLKAQLTSLANALDKNKYDNATLKLRIARLTELYHAYEEFNAELVVLDPDDEHQAEFMDINERFFTLAGKIDNILYGTNASSNSSGLTNEDTCRSNTAAAPAVQRRRIKLPDAPMPSFNGKFEQWLSFKNAFVNLIGSQSDLSDLDKLHYLTTALKGEAANKIKIFANDKIDYATAWNFLE